MRSAAALNLFKKLAHVNSEIQRVKYYTPETAALAGVAEALSEIVGVLIHDVAEPPYESRENVTCEECKGEGWFKPQNCVCECCWGTGTQQVMYSPESANPFEETAA